MRPLLSKVRGLQPICRRAFLPCSASAPASASSAIRQCRFLSQETNGKFMHDHLYPMPTYLLGVLLNDLMPDTAKGFRDYSTRIAEPGTDPNVLPQAAHLVYFPLLASASELADDGADEDHRPHGFPLATPELTKGGKRLWAGGQLHFHRGWRDKMKLDGRQWVCKEDIVDTQVKEEGKKVFVDISRRYGLPEDADSSKSSIDERRTLAFINPDKAEIEPPKPKGIKHPYTPTYSYNFKITPTHVFQFSALSYNAHFIHLDRKDALVHGPFLLAIMMRALEHHVGPKVEHFSYRIVAPLKVWSHVTVCVRAPEKITEGQQAQWDVWINGPDGNMVARGRAKMEM